MSGSLQQPDLSGLSVLVVEDEFYLAMEMSEEIERTGGSVVGPFATSDDGLAGLADTIPDCALVDINTGDGPSFDLADVLLAKGIPFAFLTGYDASSVPARFRGVERIEKPAHRRAVLAALAKLRSGFA